MASSSDTDPLKDIPVTLRGYLREEHARAFPGSETVLDIPCAEISPERIQHILAQLVAQAALHKKLSEPGLLPDGRVPSHRLPDLIAQAQEVGILNHKQAGILRAVNQDANDAKHRICP